MTAESSALGPMQQLLIGQHQRHHGLHDGYAANADAGIVTALGDDFAGITLSCHGADRDQYGTGRFEGHAQRDGLPRRNAARDPSGMIGRENRTIVARMHGNGIFLFTQPRSGETVLDLTTLYLLDAHESPPQFALQLNTEERRSGNEGAI